MKKTHSLLTALVITLPLAGAMAQNLVVNGDFEAGNTGFSNDYLYSPNDMRGAGIRSGCRQFSMYAILWHINPYRRSANSG